MAEATPTTPSSPAPAAPSPSPAPAAPVAAAPTPPAGDPSPTTPAKPEWAPDNFWDPAKGELKGADLRKSYDELTAFKAADDVKRLALPAKPEDYKLALPKDFKPPEGVEFKLDETDPLFAQARTWAKENGLSQEAFEKGIGMIAARDVATQQMLTEARNAEIGKLGATGTARVTAVNTFLDAKGLAPLKSMMVTAEIVQAMEKLVGMLSGADTFSQQHRTTPPPANEIPGIENMSFREARAAQDAQRERMNGR